MFTRALNWSKNAIEHACNDNKKLCYVIDNAICCHGKISPYPVKISQMSGMFLHSLTVASKYVLIYSRNSYQCLLFGLFDKLYVIVSSIPRSGRNGKSMSLLSNDR